MPDIKHNREAWNKLSGPWCPWSIPVTKDQIDKARAGVVTISVAGGSVPKGWLGDWKGKSILCLASGGGQQAPLLAAAGANVTVMDLSESQLALDREVCATHAIEVAIEQGTMTDLSRFGDASFDVIVNPVSNCYVPDVRPVWAECFRVLKNRGRLIAGSINPLNYLFEENDGQADEGLEVKFALPFVEYETLTEEELAKAIKRKMVFTWSHSLEDIIQGQIDAGLSFAGLCESRRTDARAPSINEYSSTYITTLAIKRSAKP